MAKKPTKLQTAIREALAEQARLESIGVIGFTRPRPKLKPGSLSMPDDQPADARDALDEELRQALIKIREAPPPWTTSRDFAPHAPLPIEGEPLAPPPSAEAVTAALKKYKAAQSKMRAARREIEKLKPLVRDAAFEYWLRRYVAGAKHSSEWTRATLLYENYTKHAGECGGNMGDIAILKEELASLTRFGILLREAGFESDRRSRPDGNYYPLRLKQGA